MKSVATATSANPLATVVLMTYNQEQFVREAIQGAFSQTYFPLEIIISDDASTDSTWDVIQKELKSYQGPHKVYARQNTKNLGINEHFNEVMILVTGEFIVIMAGDDVSLSHRVHTSVRILQENDVAGFFSNAICIDQDGNETGLFVNGANPTELLSWQTILKIGGNGGCGFSMAWHRNIRDVYGSIPDRPLGEDAFIPFRCALNGGFIYYQEPLIKYRQHNQNASLWNEINNSRNYKMKMATAKKEAQHYLSMYECWSSDIEKAYEKELIDLDEYHETSGLLSERIWLQRQRLKYLDHSLFFLIIQIVRERKAYAKIKIKRAALKELASYLSYAHPNLYKLMRWTYSRLRQFGLSQLK